jgi:hypothetical protein
MNTDKNTKKRWSAEEKENVARYAHLSPKEAMAYFPGRTYKSVKSMLYQYLRNEGIQKMPHYYTPRAFYINMGEMPKNDRFKIEYSLLPKGEVESQDLSQVEVPQVIDFDLYAMRFGFPLSDEVLRNKAA